ncbi:MAG: tripartite tricarboxylate transporter substrate binding protein [Methylocystaceae bacterium]|nr:tripartite tricarboxylate transporter substrate binding protein [Methylocystaceae bacterium]
MKAFTKNIIKVALLGALISVPFMAQAGSYPERPVTIIVPFGAGGSTDTMARAAARELEDILGTNVPVKNIGGGAGTIGAAQIARSRPDGYTIGVIPAAPLINQPHMRKTPYTINDFTYICQLFHSPQALALSPNSKFKSLKEIVDYAREHPGKLTYGSPGPASLPHLAMEKFLLEAKVDITHVPFKGDAAGVTALMGNHIDLYMAIMSNVLKKDLNAVVVFADERVKAAPNISTSIENGFKTTASWWGGIFAPKDIPAEIKAKLENACRKTTESARFQETLYKLGTLVKFKDSKAVRQAVIEGSKVNGEIIKSVLKK